MTCLHYMLSQWAVCDSNYLRVYTYSLTIHRVRQSPDSASGHCQPAVAEWLESRSSGPGDSQDDDIRGGPCPFADRSQLFRHESDASGEVQRFPLARDQHYVGIFATFQPAVSRGFGDNLPLDNGYDKPMHNSS